MKTERIEKELGFAPKIKFEDGILSTIEWYYQNESWWRPLKRVTSSVLWRKISEENR
jgi:dTDP-glucose 4,6-dehydratase